MMRKGFVLPLFPLEDAVLFPGGELHVSGRSRLERSVYAQAQAFRAEVVASLRDGESVHEVGVRAALSRDQEGLHLRGLRRCRLLEMVQDEPPVVRAVAYPDGRGRHAQRAAPVMRLLGARFARLCRTLGRPVPSLRSPDLAALTWGVAAGLGLSVEQQQGFLNVPDPVTRGRLLLATMREIERRERFLRPWARLRGAAEWN